MKRERDWLFILPSDHLGGAEQLIHNLVNSLNKNYNCKVYILTKKKHGAWSGLEPTCDIKYIPFKSYYLGFIAFIPYLIIYSLMNKTKYIFSSQTLINGLVGFTKKIGFLSNSKIIVRESTSVFHAISGNKLKLYKTAYKLGYSNTDLIICQTEFMKNQLIKAIPWIQKKNKLVVLNNPINLENISKKNLVNKNLLKEEFIITAGRLIKIKGYDILINAFKKVQDKYPNLKLFILGEGPERDSLTELKNKLNLENKVLLKGFTENVYPFFKNSSLCVVSSRLEGFPNVLLQMMSQNTKVVSTLCAGGIDKLNGVYTCPTHDSEALANSMLKCLEDNTEKNRKKFDDILSQRTIKKFIELIIKEL